MITMINRLVGLLLLWSKLATGKPTLPRALLFDLVMVVGLLIMVVVLLAAFVMSVLVGFFILLVNQGMTTGEALAVTMLVLVVTLAGVVWAAIVKVRALTQDYVQEATRHTSGLLPPPVAGIAEAFLAGLFRRPHSSG